MKQYKLGKLDAIFENIEENMIMSLAQAQEKFCEDLSNEIVNSVEIPPSSEARNPSQFENYKNSIRASSTEIEGNTIKTEIFSDYLVYWEKVGREVPVGAFLEWGTGPLGESTNTYDHGLPYTTNMPWDAHSELQYIQTGTWGIQARPHFFPAYIRNKYKLKEELEKVLK